MDIKKIDNISKFENIKSEMKFIESIEKNTNNVLNEISDNHTNTHLESKRETREIYRNENISKENIKLWTEEVEDEAWEDILNWQPSENLSIIENLDILLEIYNILKEEILINTFSNEQIEQILTLKNVLIEAITDFSNINLRDLITFLERYVNKNMSIAIKAAIFRNITRDRIDINDYNKFLDNKIKNDTKTNSYIYNRFGGNIDISKIKIDDKLDNSVKFDCKEINFKNRESIINNNFSNYDIEKADKFIKYINKNYEIFYSDKNFLSEEFLGLFTAVLSIKTETFLQYFNIGSTMSSTIKSAVNKFISYYLINTNNNLKKESKPLNSKEILKIYNYTINLFKKTNNPKISILESIKYIIEELKPKRKELFSEKLTKEKYTNLQKFEDIIIDLKNDWNKFLKNMEFKNINALKFDEFKDKSFWGIMNNNYTFNNGFFSKSNVSKVILWTLVLTFVLTGLIFLFFKVNDIILYFYIGVVLLFILFLMLKKEHK